MADVRLAVRHTSVTFRTTVLFVQIGESVGVVDHNFATRLTGRRSVGARQNASVSATLSSIYTIAPTTAAERIRNGAIFVGRTFRAAQRSDQRPAFLTDGRLTGRTLYGTFFARNDSFETNAFAVLTQEWIFAPTLTLGVYFVAGWSTNFEFFVQTELFEIGRARAFSFLALIIRSFAIFVT